MATQRQVIREWLREFVNNRYGTAFPVNSVEPDLLDKQIDVLADKLDLHDIDAEPGGTGIEGERLNS